MVTKRPLPYRTNPRIHGDDVPVYFGAALDSRLLYDSANDEWTLQIKDGGGAWTDCIRVESNTGTPTVFINASVVNLLNATLQNIGNAANDFGANTLNLLAGYVIQGAGALTLATTTGNMLVNPSGYFIINSIKTTTGDPAGSEGLIYINTFDNVVRMYADGAWRTLVSW